MRKLTMALLVTTGVIIGGSALADLTVKDGGGVTRTLKNFVCETTKLCNATVLIKSDGTEIGTAADPVQVKGTNFTPNGNYATLTATASSSASTALPAGEAVAFQNTTNTDVSCVLSSGSATATTNKLIVHGGSTTYYTVGSNVNAACINQTGSDSNVIILAGGAGLGTSFGSFDSQNMTAAVTQSGTWTVQPGNTANTTPWLVSVDNTNANGQATMASSSPVVIASNQTAIPVTNTPAAGTSGGATPAAIIAANSNNSTSLKGSAGMVYGVQTSNIDTAAAWLKLYDKATAPTCGTDTPVGIYLIPPSNSGNNVVTVVGKVFTLGIGYCIVTGIATNDNTAVPAAKIAVNFDYK